ncbi:cytosol aminopeptidase PepA [Peptoclostridium acidaminophilum DSM 3953]|uniref:Probable cytosol aminopeptidase n=1 Tax=Peptoclostridium acidaminophilum DSM 3953 TaxID=1286171 RepID=W8T135_PEPAC|nr:leucyl aminopeptidase [Peptoclostridium acidaminophilum]AHM55444.1 cytosol aminopeptidase PepA [Peptoclostridium acidaminophilum DSM 3953]
MDIRVVNLRDSDGLSDTRIIPFYEGIDLEEISFLEDSIEAMVSHLVRVEKFTGKYGQLESFRIPREKNPKNIILAGLGKEDELDLEKIRRLNAKAIKESQKLGAKSIKLYPFNLPASIELVDFARAVAESTLLTNYSFDKYKSDRKDSTLREFNIVYIEYDSVESLNEGVVEGTILGEFTILARNLTNEPANHMTPQILAEEAQKAGIQNGFDVEVLDESEIENLGMESFLSVGQASDNPPRFVIMRYFGNEKNKDEILGLVGKGITFDSGGLCIKPAGSMPEMKSDMAGAAAVIGAMSAISKLGVKANVVGVVAACENSISGHAYRPGDIIGSMAGKTIEVVNTDAEGRLTLADAVYYAVEKENVSRVVDIATLTGAALVALGTTTTAIVSNSDSLCSDIEKAASLSGEKVWRLPAFEEYKELLKSEIADIKNSGSRNASTITAGLFIESFTGSKPWAHLDIAGTSWADKDSDYIKKDGTGVGVRTLYHLAKASAETE